jgi:hypothetical protein
MLRVRRVGKERIVRGLFAWLLWFSAFFWLWLLISGDWNRIEVVGAACGAFVAATIAELVRRVAGVRIVVPLERLRASALVVPMVFVDFGILLYALLRSLARGRVVRGGYVVRPFEPGPKTTPAGAARRAWTVLLAGYSPNAYVVDFDVEEKNVVVHDLVRYRRSEEPA